MSNTRKVRRARKARERAEAQADYEKQKRMETEQRVARAQFNFKMLTDVVGKLGNNNLFYALVHGVHHSGVSTLNPELQVRPVGDLSPRERESVASMADLGFVDCKTLSVLSAFIKEHHANVGHVIYVEYKGKETLALDLAALEGMPERMLAKELGEIFAEELKGVRNV